MLGKKLDYERENGEVRFRFENGELCVTVFTGEIMNVFSPCGTKRRRSKAVWGVAGESAAAVVADCGDYTSVAAGRLEARVYDGGYVDFYRDGRLLCADYRGARKPRPLLSEKSLAVLKAEGHDVSAGTRTDYPVQAVRRMDGDEKFYGLGDKTGFLNKRGYEYENWNSDIPQAHTDAHRALYKSVPFWIALKRTGVYGIFFDNTYKTYVNLGKESGDYYYFAADGGNLDYYFIAGEEMADIVGGYTYLTGRAPLPQLWTLGYHQSRWGYDSSDCIKKVAEKFRTLKIPCDVLHLDIDYMDGYRVFTWNGADYGAPGVLQKELKDEGFKTVCIIDPGVKAEEGYAKYDEGVEGDYFVKTPDGEIYVNAVWPGDAVYPDFGKKEVRGWWADNEKFLTDMGVDGVWNDMNEPASFRGELPPDIVFSDGDEPSTHAEMHNVYGHLMSKAAYDGLARHTGKRPFVITRACYAGSQKYTTVWTGDNQSLWSHLQMAIPQLLNLGLSGFSLAGTDVGGFGADVTPELLCRWVEVGAFSTLFRNHSSNGSIYQEPWQFDGETADIYRKFVGLRYRLLPYFYDLCRECEQTGLPVLRPLVLHYANDCRTWNLNDEFLVGERLLVAPVVEQGAVKRMVYLPKGTWYDFFSGKPYDGGCDYLVDAPLDVCPVFARAGSMIPMYDLVQYIGEKPFDTLKMLVFPGEGRYVHYQDNGTDFAYREGVYNLYEFRQDAFGGVTMTLAQNGYDGIYKKIEYFKR